jgi:hypothetical protein
MRYGKQTKTRMIDIFDVLSITTPEEDQRLLELEARIYEETCDQEYYSTPRSTKKKPYDFDIDQLRELCTQQLTWQQIAEKLGDTSQRVRDFAKANGIQKKRSPGGGKITPPGQPLTNLERVRRYYEKNSPSVEELDRLMVLYGGYIGMLAYKLGKTFPIARNMLRHRGRYKTWMEYFKNGGKYDFFNK